MKPRHAVALALVGWYLMCAPRISENPLIYDVGAPLSKWTMNDSYDTAGGCRRGKDALLRPLSDGLSHADTEDRRKTLVQIFSALNDGLQCIATDDPRLNAK